MEKLLKVQQDIATKLIDSSINECFSANELTNVEIAKKFLQEKFNYISNGTVLKSLFCPKFLIDRTNLASQIPDFNFSNDARSNNYSFSSDYNMCESSTRFYASLNKGKIDIYAIQTYKKSSDCFSISEYLLIGGKLENATLIARICRHGEKGEAHKNWNGEVIEKDETHIHIMTEYFQNLEMNNYKDNPCILAQRMAYPDAIKFKDIPNIQACCDEAEKIFNLVPTEFSASLSKCKNKSVSSFLQNELMKLKEKYKTKTNYLEIPKLDAKKIYMKNPKNTNTHAQQE
ncbi:MAG: hypothetical protein WCR30_03155 [Clostridia bacterium]